MKILKDNSRKLIIDMVIVRPLKPNTFKRELKALTEDYAKKVMTMATLWRINNFVPVIPEKTKPKSTKTVDSQKILRDLRLKALAASYITAGNPLERQKALSYYFKAKKRIGPELGHQFEDILKAKNIETITGTKNLNVEWQVVLWGGESTSTTTTINEDGIEKTKTETKKVGGAGKTKNEEDLQKIEDSLMSKKCKAISDIFEAGSDFLQNFFEICFQFRNNKGEVINNNNTILPDTLLYTRTSSISIPRLKPKTFTLKTTKSSVEKIASHLPGSYEITINVRADEECKILTNFLKSSGIYEFDKDYAYNFPASAIFNDNMNTRMDIVIETISGLEHNPSLHGNTHLISVTPNEFGKYYKEILDGGKPKSMVNTPNVNLNFSEKLEWILTDARLVNISDVSFGVGNSSPVELQLQFIIKDIYLREGPMNSSKKN